jgi:hypothetical protein
MEEIITERSDGILRVELNRPSRKNAMTSAMYIGLADCLPLLPLVIGQPRKLRWRKSRRPDFGLQQCWQFARSKSPFLQSVMDSTRFGR